MAEPFYIHSKCCNAQWELVYVGNGVYEARCEQCRKKGIGFNGPKIENAECEFYKKEKEEIKN